jgi:hypothetical protein
MRSARIEHVAQRLGEAVAIDWGGVDKKHHVDEILDSGRLVISVTFRVCVDLLSEVLFDRDRTNGCR